MTLKPTGGPPEAARHAKVEQNELPRYTGSHKDTIPNL